MWDIKQSIKDVVTRNQEAFMKAGNKYILQYLKVAEDLLLEENSDD